MADANQNTALPATNEITATPKGGHASFVKTAYRASKNVNMREINRFARYYSLYRGRQLDRNYRGLAKLFVPEPHRIVSRKAAKIVNAIKRIQGVPQEPNDTENARVASIVLNFLSQRLGIVNFYRSLIKESRILSMSWAKITWEAQNEREGEQWRGYNIEQFSVDRIFVNPTATIMDMFMGKLEYLIAEYEADIHTLEKNKNYNKVEIAKVKKRAGSTLAQTPLSQQRDMNRQGQSEAAEPKQADKHYIQEFWGKIDGKDMIVVLCDGDFVLRDEENPYKEILGVNPIPFVPFPASIEPNERYPIGDIEPNESLFNELNDTRNQRMDTVTLNIDPAKIILRSAQINEKDLVAKRGWTIYSNLPNGIQFVPPDMQGVVAAINEEKIIRGDIQQSTGVLDFAPQSDLQAGINIDTARGAIIAKGEADVMTAEEIDITKESLKMFWRIMLAYAQKFLDQEFVMRIVENGAESFVKASNKNISGNIDVDIEIETLQDQTTRQTTSNMLFNQAKDVPGAKIGKFFTDVLLTFKDNINISEYYEEPPPAGPPAPNVSVSLKGDLTGMQAAQVYKSIPGVDPVFADPLTVPEGRAMMRGDLPELGKSEENKNNAAAIKDKAEANKTVAETADILTKEEPEVTVSAK